MEFEWDEEPTEEDLDELIEQVEDVGGEGTGSEYDPSPAPVDEVTEPQYDPSPGPADDVVADSAPVEAVDVPTEVPAEAPAEMPVEETPMALEEPVVKKKTLSMLGIAFAVLAVVSVIGLMVVLNYDVWINGDAENNIGDTQMMYVYLAVVAVIVCIMITVFDLVRNRKAV